MQEHTIETKFGTLWTACSEPQATFQSNPAILCLHGNSCSSRIFNPLFDKNPRLKESHKLIFFDYPGHGRSSDAPNPERSYYQYAYAEAAGEVLRHYNVREVILFGWSLGGHVALELVSVLALARSESERSSSDIRIAGIMITGTPPVPKQQITGFRKDVNLSALFNPEASDESVAELAPYFTQSMPPTWLIEDLVRTNRLAGRTMASQFMAGLCSDQIKIVHEFKDGWIAVVNGGADPLLDVDYCASVCHGAPSLWRGECILVKDTGHAPFYDDPEQFGKLFSDFVNDCCTKQKTV